MNSVKSLILSTNGKWFSASFIKKDGSIRDMVCRLGVKKHLQGGENRNPNLGNTQVVVFESNKGYRTITFAKVVRLKVNKMVYDFN